jgi:hypothetical protein
MPDADLLTEEGLTVVNGLVAHLKRLEAEYLRTRSVKNGDALYIQIDGIRWRLKSDYRVIVRALDGKSGPDGKISA